MLLIHFIFFQTYFLIASSQIFKNDAILINQKNFIYKLLYLTVINSISKIGNSQVVENLFPKQINHDLLESHHFLKFGSK